MVNMFLTMLLALFGAMCAYGGELIGEYQGAHHRMRAEIDNRCAYYDMDSGKFTWGQKPVVMGSVPASEVAPVPVFNILGQDVSKVPTASNVPPPPRKPIPPRAKDVP